MENEFYDRIVYKKSAYTDLKEDLEKYYYGKNIFLITSKSLVNGYFTEVMNSISMAKCSFKHFVSKNNFSLCELKQIIDMLTFEKFDLIIAFGSGKVTNVSKYFASTFNIPYFLCPTGFGTITYFDNICINPYDATRNFICDYAERIYINESVIKTAPQKQVKQGIYLMLSLYELITTTKIENVLLNSNVDTSNLLLLETKLKNELKNIMSGDNDEKLKLMDMLIDLAYNLKDFDMLKNSTFNLSCILTKMYCDENEYVGGGEINLIASKTILLGYKNLFCQKKIKQLDIPDFVKIAEKIKKFSIFSKKTNGFSYFNGIINKKDVIVRLNNLKEEFFYQCNKSIEEMNNMMTIIKSYNEIFDYQLPSVSSLFDAFNIMPFVTENNSIINLMCGMGYLNAF